MKKTAGERAEIRMDEADTRLVELQEECFSQLKQVVLIAARELLQDQHISGVNEVIPLQCLREISKDLPVSVPALAMIEHMTDYRVRNYHEVILGVTNEFHSLKLDHLACQAIAHHENDDFAPSSQFNGWVGKSDNKGNRKSAYFNQKKSWGWNGSKNKRRADNRGVRAVEKTPGEGKWIGGVKNKSTRSGGGSMGLPKSKM